jgi:hypothetical protein
VAYSFASITADEIARAAADKPLLIPARSNALRRSTGVNSSRWTEVGTTAATDRSDANFPAANAFDLRTHVPTKEDGGTLSSEWFLVSQMFTPFSDFDTLVILGHNLKSEANRIADPVDVELQIADDGAFTTNLETVANFSIPNNAIVENKRIVSLSLFHTGSTALRYSNVEFARLRIFSAGADIFPEIGEVLLGRRRQWKHAPDRPFGVDDQQSQFSDFVSGTGGRVRYLEQAQLRRFSGAIAVNDATVRSDLLALRNESKGLSSPIVWVTKPTADPGAAIWTWPTAGSFDLPEVGPGEDSFVFDLLEDGFLPYQAEL